ncbi:MAG TPA: hypothetical protein VGY99_24765 [Candidatus Binataceae bacterium]|jgi:hypothetical protein|nr:hypothetical protein [Candidatus Binataceae bacterium]
MNKVRIALLVAGLCISAVFGFYNFFLLLNSTAAEAQASEYPATLDGTDVSAFGVRYDVKLAAGMISAGSNKFRATSATVFSSADVGKDIIVYSRGNGPMKRMTRGNVWTGCIGHVDTPAIIAIGSWVGNSCVPSTSSFPALTDMYFILYGTDNTAALQSAIEHGGNDILDLKGSVMIKNSILFFHKTGKFEGMGPEGNLTTATPSGSNIIWAGPAGIPMIKLRADVLMTITNVHLVGNGNPAHRPSAFFDLAQEMRPPYAGLTSMDSFINISNDPAGQPGQGPFADTGVYFDDQKPENDVHMFYSLRLFNLASTCVDDENQQSIAMDFKDFYCANTPVAWYAPHGGQEDFTGVFTASNVGQVFHQGRFNRAAVDDLEVTNTSRAEAGYSQLAYFESNKFSAGGGQLIVYKGRYELSSNIPTHTVTVLGHRLTPYTVIDTDNSTISVIDLQNFSFLGSSNLPLANANWFFNLTPDPLRNNIYLRCYQCSGLSAQSLSRIRSGTNPSSMDIVEIKQMSPTLIYTRQLLTGGRPFIPSLRTLRPF